MTVFGKKDTGPTMAQKLAVTMSRAKRVLFVDDDEANRMRGRAYRAPWHA